MYVWVCVKYIFPCILTLFFVTSSTLFNIVFRYFLNIYTLAIRLETSFIICNIIYCCYFPCFSIIQIFLNLKSTFIFIDNSVHKCNFIIHYFCVDHYLSGVFKLFANYKHDLFCICQLYCYF